MDLYKVVYMLILWNLLKLRVFVKEEIPYNMYIILHYIEIHLKRSIICKKNISIFTFIKELYTSDIAIRTIAHSMSVLAVSPSRFI